MEYLSRETKAQLDLSCYQVKHLVPGLGYILSSCWSKGSHGNPQTTQAIAMTICCSPQTDKALLLKSTPTLLTEY